MRALLDVNVLIALLDSAHVHHNTAMAWLEREQEHGWASCPLTQNGCIRIMSQPAYPGDYTPAEVAHRVGEAVADPTHKFWPDDVSLLDERPFDWSHVFGHRQVTDVYLLQLAVRHQGRFVTFDKGISLAAVTAATEENLVVLSA